MDFIYSQRGHPLIILNNFVYRKNRRNYWRCVKAATHKCTARLIVSNGTITKFDGYHLHDVDLKRIEKGRTVRKAIKIEEIRSRNQQDLKEIKNIINETENHIKKNS